MGEGMRRSVYFHQDPTFEGAAENIRKEEREKRKQAALRRKAPCSKGIGRQQQSKKLVPAVKVLYRMRQIAKAAGYRVVGNITIRQEETGYIFKSFYEGR